METVCKYAGCGHSATGGQKEGKAITVHLDKYTALGRRMGPETKRTALVTVLNCEPKQKRVIHHQMYF